MTITESQRISIMKTWTAVCKDRGWKASDKGFRLAKFSEIIGRPIASANDIERIDECTKLMKELQAMLGVSLKAGMEANDPYINRARVLRNQILTEIIPCLELYRGDKVADDLAGIMEDKNRWWKINRPARSMTLMDLDAKPIKSKAGKYVGSQLSQIQWTLARWLNDLRNEAGDTIHAMNQKAGVACKAGHCAVCFPKPVCTVTNAAVLQFADEQQAKEEKAHAVQPF